MLLQLRIDPDGDVVSTELGGDLADDSVRACIAAEPPTWKFAPGDITTEINYPLHFKPAGT